VRNIPYPQKFPHIIPSSTSARYILVPLEHYPLKYYPSPPKINPAQKPHIHSLHISPSENLPDVFTGQFTKRQQSITAHGMLVLAAITAVFW